MVSGTVRFGIVGTGIAAGTHARELRSVPGAALMTVLARRREAAETFAATHGAERAYDDPALFLTDAAIDAVIVATPNGLHHDIAIAAARAGKHVVVEKPLEIATDRARAIVDACERAGVRLFVIYQMRWSAAALQAKADIDAGRLGRILLVNILDNEYRPPAYYARDAWRGTKAFEGGGCLITQTSHLLDLVQHLVGPVASVFAYTATALHAIETEDTAVAAIRFRNGALGTISSSTAAYPAQRHLVAIVGTEGSIVFNGEHDQIVLRASQHDETQYDVPTGFSFRDPEDPLQFPTLGQRRQLAAIVASLRGETAQTGTAEDHLTTPRFLDSIYRSAALGMEVRVDEG